MAYADIVFHNIQSRNNVVNGAGSYADYIGVHSNRRTRLGFNYDDWGASVTGNATAVGIFLCESPVYGNYHANWANQWNRVLPNNHGFEPVANLNRLCAFWPGQAQPQGADDHPPGNWIYSNGVYFQGTGNELNGNAPPGSDRYGIRFRLHWPYFGANGRVSGIFVHAKNTDADPGTQIAALCRLFPQDLILGDLNLNLRNALKLDSLRSAVGATHQILGLQQDNQQYYFTRYNANGAGTSCLDYVLVPNDRVDHVELRAHQANNQVPVLSRNESDHSVMILRIRVDE